MTQHNSLISIQLHSTRISLSQLTQLNSTQHTLPTLRVNHFDFCGFTRCGYFLKGYSVLVRVEIIHKSNFFPGTVEKNWSTIRSSGRNRTYACANLRLRNSLISTQRYSTQINSHNSTLNSTESTQLTHVKSTPFNSNQLISTHTTQLNSTHRRVSPYLIWYQLTHLNSTPFSSNQLISTHTTQLGSTHRISPDTNSLYQLNSIQIKSTHTTQHSTQLTQHNSLISIQLKSRLT